MKPRNKTNPPSQKWRPDGLTWFAIVSVFAGLYVMYETKDWSFTIVIAFFAWLVYELGKPASRTRGV